MQTSITFSAWIFFGRRSLAANPVAQKALRDAKRGKTKLTIDVYPEVVNDLKRFGINLRSDGSGKVSFGGYNENFSKNVAGMSDSSNLIKTTGLSVGDMSATEKIGEAIKRSLPLLPKDVAEEIQALLRPEVLAVVGVVVIAWAIGHFFVASEIVDVIVLLLGVIAFGAVAIKAGDELVNFAMKSVYAKTEDDLNQAAKHFSEAVAPLGVQAVRALLVKYSPKGITGPVPETIKTIGRAPVTKGKWFYRPRITRTKSRDLRAGEGYTDEFGNVVYSARGSYKTQSLVRIHEKVHSFLTPKLQFLREYRVVLATNSYSKSSLLRYLEEALAETVAQVSVNGWQQGFKGVTFPVREGYVTIAEMGKEVAGMWLGPITAGGMTYKVFYTFTKPQDNDFQDNK